MAAVKGSARRAVLQAAVLLSLAVVAGALRQTLPGGLSWNGRWPTAETSAEDAYKMMSREGDPVFAPVGEAISLHRAGARFLDARDAAEFAAGRIPGAHNLPFYDLETHRQAALEGLSPDSPIVVYCEGVGCELSLFLGRELQQMGYTDVKIFYGGFPEWKTAGLPVEQ